MSDAAQVGTQRVHSGARSLHLDADGSRGIDRFTQTVAATELAGDRLRVIAYVLVPPATGNAASLWVRVDDAQGRLVYVDRARVDATGAWTRASLDVPLLPTAARITFGGELRGRGEAWFDDFALETFATDTLPPPSAAALDYVERALAIVRGNAMQRATVDWPSFEAAVRRQARGAATIADSYLAVRYALAALDDGHSYFMAPGQMASLATQPVENARTGRATIAPRAELLDGPVAYLSLPGFAGGTHADQARFAANLQEHIAALDASAVCGWILDLRANAGGNLWPMLAGVGPLLGDGEVAASLDASGTRTPVWYRDGKAGLGDTVQLRLRGDAYRLRSRAPPIAVLASNRTASAAEIIAGAFAALPGTRSFGAETAGAVSATRIFPLVDGAALVLAVAATTDRLGRVYDGPLAPDTAIPDDVPVGPLALQPAVRAARDWLRADPACSVPADAAQRTDRAQPLHRSRRALS